MLVSKHYQILFMSHYTLNFIVSAPPPPQHAHIQDNINYATGFCNLTALEVSSGTYDYATPMDAGAALPEKMLEDHYDLVESTLSNVYESVHVQGGSGTYSEVVGHVTI